MAITKKKTVKKKVIRNPKTQNYLNNAGLLEQIRLSKTIWEERKRGINDPDLMPSAAECMTSELVNMIIMLVNRYAQRASWRGYTYVEDMKSEAQISLLNGALKFKPEVGNNPFGYLTQIVTHSFLTTLDKEKKVRNIRDDILEQHGLSPSNTRQLENEQVMALSRRIREWIRLIDDDAIPNFPTQTKKNTQHWFNECARKSANQPYLICPAKGCNGILLADTVEGESHNMKCGECETKWNITNPIGRIHICDVVEP